MNSLFEVSPWFSYGLAALSGGGLAATLVWALVTAARSRTGRRQVRGPMVRARYGMSRRRIAEACFEEMRNLPWC